MIADRGLDEARGLERGQTVLGLALEMGIADEHAEHELDAVENVVGGDVLGLLVADQLTEGADALGQRGAEARFVGAAVGRRDGVAVIAFAAVGIERPGDGPFGASLVVGEGLAAGERLVGDCGTVAELLGEIVGKAAGEVEDGLLRHLVRGQARVAAPADFDPGEEIGLGAGELVEPLGAEARVGAEDLGVGREGRGRAATVGGGTDFLELRGRDAPGEGLAIELLLARDLDNGFDRERVDDADADAVKAAGGRIGLALELPAGVEGGHDHFERRLAGIFGMGVNRDAAAVVGDGQTVAGLQRHLDAAGVAGDRLVHRIVDDLCGEMMERAVVGAADVHAGAAADGLEALEHLDGASVVAVGGGSGVGRKQVGHLRNGIGRGFRRCQPYDRCFPQVSKWPTAVPKECPPDATMGLATDCVREPSRE